MKIFINLVKNSSVVEVREWSEVVPIGRGIGKVKPRVRVPEDDSSISKTSVRATTKRIESNALWSLDQVQELNLGLLQQIMFVLVGGNVRPWGKVDRLGLEFREMGYWAVVEGVQPTVESNEEEEDSKSWQQSHGKIVTRKKGLLDQTN